TGHAVLSAERHLAEYEGDVLILNGDLPVLRPDTLTRFADFHRSSGAPLSLVTAAVESPAGYGRIIRTYNGDVSRIVEEADATADVDVDVKVGQDTILEPGVMLFGATEIGRGVTIGAGSRITDSVVGDGTALLPYCVVASSRIGRACRIGPFAHLRPDTQLDEEARIGNFVETKKIRMGQGSKANHLTYLGDAEIGRSVNIGAGTITCNYDGVQKLPTVIEDEVF